MPSPAPAAPDAPVKVNANEKVTFPSPDVPPYVPAKTDKKAPDYSIHPQRYRVLSSMLGNVHLGKDDEGNGIFAPHALKGEIVQLPRYVDVDRLLAVKAIEKVDDPRED